VLIFFKNFLREFLLYRQRLIIILKASLNYEKKHFLNLNVSILKKHKNKVMFVCNCKKFFGNVIKPDQASQSRDTRPSSLCGQGFKSNCRGRGWPMHPYWHDSPKTSWTTCQNLIWLKKIQEVIFFFLSYWDNVMLVQYGSIQVYLLNYNPGYRFD